MLSSLSNLKLKKFIFPMMLLALAWIFYKHPHVSEIAAGIAILLFGIIMLEDGFNAFVQGPMERMLKKMSESVSRSFTFGFITTAILQSSALISVVAISFLSAGLISLKSGIAVAFGANLGTTSTAWLVSTLGFKLDIASFAFPILAFGILFVLQKNAAVKGVGFAMAGLGFFFLGIEFMQTGFETYQDKFDLSSVTYDGLLGVFVFAFIGVLLTIVLQSGSAVIVLVLTMLQTSQLEYFNALALVVGANIGNVATMILGALNANSNGKRLAGAQVIFKLSAGIVSLLLIFQLADFVDFVAENVGVDENNFAIKLSIFHTLFNLIGVLLMMPVLHYIIKFLKRLIPDQSESKMEIARAKYLNKSILKYPQSTIRALLDESKYLFEKTTLTIVAKGLFIDPKAIKSDVDIEEIIDDEDSEYDIDVEEMYYSKVKIIYGKIIKYATLSESEFALTPKILSAFARVKDASRNQVLIIKNIRGLHKNVKLYLNSDNKYIEEEYEKMRKFVAHTLRQIHILQKNPESVSTMVKLDEIKETASTRDLLLSGRFEYLIREHKISSVMASSLANDSSNVNEIVLKMIESAELLYIERNHLLKLTEDA
ncbi:Na/Pi cotransporter family protein [Brumimicrobium mesophilum]|uniref:Na/Pi cotransporter family protein n=1 Tax=Brumimicrobium mesophilum TaxID=392717 RepID=UPI0018FEFD78|nr:Na/Pi symporter [Brumimicrobium mesophilum]